MRTITTFDKIMDGYYHRPILIDCLIVIAAFCVKILLQKTLHINFSFVKIMSKGYELNYVSNIIATSVSLAGFMVAALTIMVTVKSSLQARGFGDSKNALEYLFSTKHYNNIIRVFRQTIVELIMVFSALYCIWLFSANVETAFIFECLLASIFWISAAIIRSLYLLFAILNLEKYSTDN